VGVIIHRLLLAEAEVERGFKPAASAALNSLTQHRSSTMYVSHPAAAVWNRLALENTSHTYTQPCKLDHM